MSRLSRLPLLLPTLAFAAGIVLQRLVEMGTSYLWLIAATAGLLLIGLRRVDRGRTAAVLLAALWLSAGALHWQGWSNDTLVLSYRQHLPLGVDSVLAEVVALSDQRRPALIIRPLEVYRGKNIADGEGRWTVRLPEGAPRFRPGDRLVLINVRVEAPQPARNPGQFDYAAFLETHGIVALVYLKDSEQLRQVDLGRRRFSFNRLSDTFFHLVESQLGHYLTPDAAAFMRALLLGKKQAVDMAVLNDFRRTGIMHVLAISGLHIGFLGLMIQVLLSFLPISFKQCNLLTALLLLFYALMTGVASALRAALMGGCYLLSVNFERRGTGLNFLCGAALLILIFQPQQLFWAGFQFSCAATASILIIYPRLDQATRNWSEAFPGKPGRILRTAVLQPVWVTLAAQAGTLPLALSYFHALPLAGLVLNLAVVPLIAFLVAGGCLLIVLSVLHSGLAALLGDFLSGVINLLESTIASAARLPGIYLEQVQLNWGALLFAIALAGILLQWQRRGAWMVVVSIAIPMWLSSIYPARPAFDLLQLDVGQGDAALIRTSAQQTVLIDCGPPESADRALLPAMRSLAAGGINHLFISHAHLDHIGGLFELAGRIRIDSVYLPRTSVGSSLEAKAIGMLGEHGIPFRMLEAGDIVEIDQTTRAYILWPPASQSKAADLDINNASLVLLLRHRDQAMLFTGDAESEAEERLLRWGMVLKSDILKVGHHGSRTSTAEAFLALISPGISVVSAGRFNRFGHPAKHVMRRLQDYDSKVMRTDQSGALWLRLTEAGWREIDWRAGHE